MSSGSEIIGSFSYSLGIGNPVMWASLFLVKNYLGIIQLVFQYKDVSYTNS